jgi:hypothetical protein
MMDTLQTVALSIVVACLSVIGYLFWTVFREIRRGDEYIE